MEEFPEYRHLPRIPFDALELVHDTDYYDGPIAGLLKHGDALYYFSWDSDADMAHGRTFVLRELPPEVARASSHWLVCDAALRGEYRLVANPHAYPVSDMQRQRMRSLQAIERDMEQHRGTCPHWQEHPITAWCEGWSDAFSPFTIISLSQETAERLGHWQRDVARALAREDQATLDALFSAAPCPCDPLDIFYVRLKRPDGAFKHILRDHRGQPLPQDFELKAEHRIQHLHALLSEPTKAG